MLTKRQFWVIYNATVIDCFNDYMQNFRLQCSEHKLFILPLFLNTFKAQNSQWRQMQLTSRTEVMSRLLRQKKSLKDLDFKYK